MVEFAGYNMPISYTGINEEHAAVRSNAGVFDVSHMGEFILKGEHAQDLLQRVTTNDVSKLTAGKAQYSCLTNDSGGIVDDLLVYCIEENKVYMVVVNASNIEKDWDWIRKHNIKDAESDTRQVSTRTEFSYLRGRVHRNPPKSDGIAIAINIHPRQQGIKKRFFNRISWIRPLNAPKG